MTRNSGTVPAGRGTPGKVLLRTARRGTPSDNGFSNSALLWDPPENDAYQPMGCHETGVMYSLLTGTDLPAPGPVRAGGTCLIQYPSTASGASCFPGCPDQGALPSENNHEVNPCNEHAGRDQDSYPPQVMLHPAVEAGSCSAPPASRHPGRETTATAPGHTGSSSRVEGTFPALRPCRHVEYLARDLLADNGYYAVRVTSPKVPVDIVAWKRSGVLLIGVVRTRAPVQSARNAIERCASLVAGLRSVTCPAGCSVQLWFYSSRSGWRFYTVHPHGLMEVPGEAWV